MEMAILSRKSSQVFQGGAWVYLGKDMALIQMNVLLRQWFPCSDCGGLSIIGLWEIQSSFIA